MKMRAEAESDIDTLRTQIALKEAAIAELFVQLSGLHKQGKRAVEHAEAEFQRPPLNSSED